MKKFLTTQLFVYMLLSFIACQSSANDTDFRDLSVSEAYQIITDNTDNPDFIIIDVRTDSEIADGMIEKARHIDINGADFESQIDALNRENTYLVYCRSGSRSDRAQSAMETLDFKKVYDMRGGFTAWLEAEYPYVIPE